MNTKEKIAYYLLEKKYHKIGRDVKISGLNNTNKVGVIWALEDKEAFLYISGFLKEKQVIFRSLCYTGTSNEVIAHSFSKKETNFWGFPKSSDVNTFMEFEYDILMNISVSSCFTLDAVTALTRAHFKIGWASGPVNFFDMNIDVSSNKNALYLVKQQIHYIEEFNK